MKTDNDTIRAAEDGFETYFAEKIWEMIPAFYRTEDGLAENPGVLRSLVEIIAEQAAIVRRSQDRLWEDQFIELCSDWVVPYLADLLHTRLVPALNERGRRADVANTIAQRRSSGTLRVLEQLISRITDWEGTVVEQFRRLGRTRHGLDPKLNTPGLPGRFSATPPGGWANLRSPRISELAGGPFDEYHHTPDFRQPWGRDGWYGIHKLAFHLYRLKAYEVKNATPFPLFDHPGYDGLRFTFDPSGREIPLFMPRNRPENLDAWRAAKEWELPAPIRCRLLNHAEYVITEAVIQDLADHHGLQPAQADDLRAIARQRFRTERRLRETLASTPNARDLLLPVQMATLVPLLEKSRIADCGKSALLPNAVDVDAGPPESPLLPARIISGDLSAGSLSAAAEKRLVIDPEHGIFSFQGDPVEALPVVSYHYGFSAPIGAGTYSRLSVEEVKPDNELGGGVEITADDLLNKGVLQLNDSKTYGPVSDKLSVRDLTVQAQNLERPYLRLESNWILNTGLLNKESFATLEGLWLGVQRAGDALILRGDYECVTISHCTLDPGGDTDLFDDPVHPVELIIEARIDQLRIDASILGPVRVQGPGLVESTVICDSIIQSTDLSVKALEQNLGVVTLDRVTVFGEVDVHRLKASETVITGHVDVTDTQNGCFRFSLAPSGSRLPRAYPHAPMPFTESNHWFTSRRFGDPGYAQVSETAPAALRRGAENGSEIGAFSSLLHPIKSDSLRAKVTEYLPFGLLPIFIHET